MSDINLLPNKHVGVLVEDKASMMLRRIAIFVLCITASIAIVLFIITIQSPLSQRKKQEQTLLATLALSKERLSRSVIIQERLGAIDRILKQRNTYDKTIEQVIEKVPPSVTVTSIQIKKSILQLTGNSTSLDATDTFVDALVELKQTQKNIKAISLQNYALQVENRRYYFTVEITML